MTWFITPWLKAITQTVIGVIPGYLLQPQTNNCNNKMQA